MMWRPIPRAVAVVAPGFQPVGEVQNRFVPAARIALSIASERAHPRQGRREPARSAAAGRHTVRPLVRSELAELEITRAALTCASVQRVIAHVNVEQRKLFCAARGSGARRPDCASGVETRHISLRRRAVVARRELVAETCRRPAGAYPRSSAGVAAAVVALPWWYSTRRPGADNVDSSGHR
jgi:hypothetical protein